MKLLAATPWITRRVHGDIFGQYSSGPLLLTPNGGGLMNEIASIPLCS